MVFREKSLFVFSFGSTGVVGFVDGSTDGSVDGLTEANKVEEVIIESIHPPVELSDVYQSVVSADVNKTTTITNAESEAEKIILEAEKDAKTTVITAKENQTTKVADATKEMTVYKAALEEYRKRLFVIDKKISFFENNIRYTATVNDINDLCNLIVTTSYGETKTLSSGEISIIL